MEHVLSHNHLKNFIIAAKQYSFSINESTSNSVLYSLQILGQSSNQFVFDSKYASIDEFYINLYELMNNSNDQSDIIWAAINVLQSIAKQGLFYNSKLKKYNFLSILTKLLKDELPLDRKIKLLKLLQEFTYRENLQWQESYISELIILLVKWISSENNDLISLSLGILVNLCCENNFSMFTLVKCTHSKQFMRLLLKLQSDDIFIKIQVYKLLLALEKVSGQVPHVDVHNLIDVTFIVLEEGIKLKNTFVLHHAIDFFIDISKHSHWAPFVLEYPDFNTKLINILEAMDNFKYIEKTHNNYKITLQSVGLVLQLINHIIQLKDFFTVYPQIISHIIQWAQFLDLYGQSMSILHTIISTILRMHNINIDQKLQCNIYKKLEDGLDMLINVLLEPNINIQSEFNIHTWNKYAECLRVLQEMIKIQQFYEKIEEKFCISSLQSIFHSLMLIDINDLNNLENITFVYIEALCFLSDLVAKNPIWMSLYSEVLNQKHVYNVLAYIIYNGPKKMKQKVFELITKFSQQSTLMLSDCLEEIEQYSSSKIKNLTIANSIDTDLKPLCSFAQEQQFQKFIDQLENKFNSNEVDNIQTSNVIKLYQYKINTLKQTEIWLKKSLSNASEEITKLNYEKTCLNNETMQLNQMLLNNHQKIDELIVENSEIKQKLNDVTVQFSTTSNNFAKLSKNYESKRLIIQEQDSTIKNLENQLKELQIESNTMKINLTDQLQNEKSENKIQISKFEQQLKDKNSIINEKIDEIDSKASFIKNLENCILDKDKDIVDLRKQLQEQHRVREMISQMLAATSSKPQFSDN